MIRLAVSGQLFFRNFKKGLPQGKYHRSGMAVGDGFAVYRHDGHGDRPGGTDESLARGLGLGD